MSVKMVYNSVLERRALPSTVCQGYHFWEKMNNSSRNHHRDLTESSLDAPLRARLDCVKEFLVLQLSWDLISILLNSKQLDKRVSSCLPVTLNIIECYPILNSVCSDKRVY